MRSLLKQPLTHFLVAGILIFVAYAWFEPDSGGVGDPRRSIAVNREVLLDFMQYRAQVFDNDLYSQRFDALTVDQRNALVREYILEEVLYREAVDLGLDDGDYDIRLRMVEKMSFLLEEAARGSQEQIEPDPEQLRSYYEQRADQYRDDGRYTFAHVFFDREKQDEADALRSATTLLAELRDRDVAPDDAAGYGDAFPYLNRYRAAFESQIVREFGQNFVDQLDRLDPGESAWSGPFASELGWHLVALTERIDSRLPPLDEIRDEVVDDYRSDAVLAAVREAASELVESYEVSIDTP